MFQICQKLKRGFCMKIPFDRIYIVNMLCAKHINDVNPVEGNLHAETTLELLADLEHEFRVPRDSVWLGFAARQHEPDLQVPARRRKLAALPLARWSNYRSDHSTDYRVDERSHLEPARPAPSLLSQRRDSRECRSLLHA